MVVSSSGVARSDFYLISSYSISSSLVKCADGKHSLGVVLDPNRPGLAIPIVRKEG
jgi:hypothetical protein